MRRSRFAFFTLTISTIFLAAEGLPRLVPSARADAATSVSADWEMSLSQILASRASGIRHEGLEANQIELLRDQARAFLEYRRSKLGAKEKLFFTAECFEKAVPNIFCRYVGDKETLKRGRSPVGAGKNSGRARSDTYKIADAITAGKFGDLDGFVEGQFHKALTLFPDFASLELAASKALSGGCVLPEFLTALGQKEEQFFPSPAARARALALFEKSARCGTEDSSQKAGFRASLLQIWAGHCEKADPLLAQLSKFPNGDYASRSIYWRAYCAQEQGNKLLAKVMKTRLLKEHPLSFHGLLLAAGGNSSPDLRHLLDAEEPKAHFRSELKPELNALVRGAELLLDFDAPDLARTILDDVMLEGDKTEATFRAYLATLYGRVGDRIGQFRTLSGVFRDDPRFITRSTLQLFYPLRRFEAIRPQGKKVDPYLLAALIRQESGFNEYARSPVGALGLMQLMPATARTMQRRISKRQILDPTNNVRLGARYFHGLLERFDYDAELALAAYNAGPMRVEEWRRRYPTENRMIFFDMIPYKETRDYVALISRNYFWYLSLYDDRDLRLKDEEGRLPASVKNTKPLVFTLFRR